MKDLEMTIPHTLAVLAVLAALLTLTTAAGAQPDVLKGPSVPVETQHTLGETSMNGHFTPVEGRPELAAFALLTHNPDRLNTARDLGNKRIFELTIYLVDEIDTVKAITDAMTEGQEPRAQLLLANLRTKYDPDLARDPLADDLRALLPQDQRAEFDRIIDDYWARWTHATLAESGKPINNANLKRTENLLNNQLFQADIGSAYDGSLKRYKDFLDAIYTAITPTDEQHALIRAMVIEHIKATRLKSTIEQRLELMKAIYRMLDPDRREKLFLFLTRAAIAGDG